ncbi:hypothetical protein ACFYY8_33390 [Streptosporangium sp. NPDC001559]|uniref:hypothetical protein n=1 Tax=Streptosporangium sp. NPDC001559 TaxID=3366187 RepID=UPI0036E1C10B
MTACMCEAHAHDPGLSPCETHTPETFAAWLTEKAPRVAAARAAGDPLADLYPLPERAADVAELANLRAALSEPAHELLETEWDLVNGHGEQWPHANEFALAARDSWQDMVPVYERNVLREELASATIGDYPIDDRELGRSGLRVATSEELLEEADELAVLVQHAQAMERMLRDHAAGRATTVADYC